MLPLLCVATLPLSTAAQEVATALCLILTLVRRPSRALAAPWIGPGIALGAVWVLSSLASGNLHEGLGHAWLLAPLVALPGLAAHRRTIDVGLAAATVAALVGVVQLARGEPSTGPFSHHLTLAYALLPPFAAAVARRHPLAVPIALGILSTRSAAAPIALVVTAGAAVRGRAWAWVVGGLAATLALLPWSDPDELHQRAILWTGGLDLVGSGGVGAGAYAAQAQLVYDRLEKGFWFPNHAHDSSVQALAVLGPAGLAAQTWLVAVALTRGSRAGAAGLAGIAVGSLTQEVFGDLEVARAAWVWLALLGEGQAEGVEGRPDGGAAGTGAAPEGPTSA